MQLTFIVFDQYLRCAVTIALHALGQIMLNGLLQRPVAKTNHIAVVRVGEETGNALGSAQLQGDIGVGRGTQGEGREGESCEFQHAQILVSVVP
ncbi:hypothetical protein D9M73_297760 [compost metagenome]